MGRAACEGAERSLAEEVTFNPRPKWLKEPAVRALRRTRAWEAGGWGQTSLWSSLQTLFGKMLDYLQGSGETPQTDALILGKIEGGRRRGQQRMRWLDDITNSMVEKAMATHSSTLAWKIPWMEEPGRLQSIGSWRVRHN